MGGYPQIIHFNRISHYKPSILDTPIDGNPHVEDGETSTKEFGDLEPPRSKININFTVDGEKGL